MPQFARSSARHTEVLQRRKRPRSHPHVSGYCAKVYTLKLRGHAPEFSAILHRSSATARLSLRG